MKFKKNWKRFWTLDRHCAEGFTLVELIVVIAILAILAGVAVPAYSGYIEKANVAADEVLLSTLNTAFAAAAAGNGVTVNSAELTYGGSTGAVTVTAVESINGATPSATFTSDFNAFWTDNENSVFKTIARLNYNAVTHMFEIYSTAAQQAAIDAFNKSNLAGKEVQLAGSVDNLAGLLATWMGPEEGNPEKTVGLDALAPYLGEDLDAFKAAYNLDENSSEQEVANAAVLYVASKAKDMTAEDVMNTISSNPSNVDQAIVNKYGALPSAAMMFGVITSYANSEHVSDDFKNTYDAQVKELDGLSDVTSLWNTMMKDSGFSSYKGDDWSEVKTDMDGYFSAMGIISNYEGEFDLSSSNAFSNDETLELLNQILGNSN